MKLIQYITEYCNNQFSISRKNCGCSDCNHPKKCSKSCKKCLEQVHYYNNNVSDGKKYYDCKHLINFYVCDYSFKYASEILYLLRKSDRIKEFEQYNVVSIGCGGCSELMALETFLWESNPDKNISYVGFDINNYWKMVHNEIKKYQQHNKTPISQIEFKYEDAIDYFKEKQIKKTNVLFLQYVISYFYNTKKIDNIEVFFDDLIKNIINYKTKESPIIILINDVNSKNRGRDYFKVLANKLSESNFKVTRKCFYFDYNVKYDGQRYGEKHLSSDILYNIPKEFNNIYSPWKSCSSAQLLIEVE